MRGESTPRSAEAAVKNLSARGTPARATSPTSTAKRSDYALVAPSVMSDMMGDGDESDPDSSSGEDETVEEIFARLDADGSGSLEEEELDVKLLRSMGEQVLKSNMADLGMTDAEAARLSGALFAVDVS